MKPGKKPKHSEVAVIEECKRRLRSQLARGVYSDAARTLNELGHQQRCLGLFEDALESHKREVEICRSHTSRGSKEDRMGLGLAYRGLAEVYIDSKAPARATPAIQRYLSVARELENEVEEQRALITMGRGVFSQIEAVEEGSDPRRQGKLNATLAKSAEEWFRKAYALLDNPNLKVALKSDKEFQGMKANNCQNLGLALEEQGKFSQAVKWFQKAVEIGRGAGLLEYIHPNSVSLCGLYLKGGESQKALRAAEEALKAATSLGNLSGQFEAKLLEARATLSGDEVEAGKNILKKLRRKLIGKADLAPYLEECDALLLPAVKLSRKLNSLADTNSSRGGAGLGPGSMLRLHEGIADAYADLSLFSFAIENYLKAVKFARDAGLGGDKLCSLYFSIAESYKDCGEYEKALEYYGKEMELYHNAPDEKFKTQLKITGMLEKWKEGEEVVAAHETTIRLARELKSPKKLVRALEDFASYLKSVGDLKRAELRLKEVEEIRDQFSGGDEEPESQEDILSDGDESGVDLDNLSSDGVESEEEDEEEKGTFKNVAQVKRRLARRRNEAGETPLHIASKKGDLNAVRKWLRQGFDVNASDTAGWTPLHEAANYGYPKVVEALLEAGARVNDPGGTLCEGITPLHDALSNGHFSVADVLLDKGASVLVRDKKKLLPIDHLIVWRNGVTGEELAGVHEDYRRMKDLLKEKMAEKGRPYRPEDEARAVREGLKRSKSPEFTLLRPTTSCPIPVRIANDSFHPGEEEEEDGAKLYQNTIRGLIPNRCGGGSGGEERPRPRRRRVISPGPRNALIPSELDVHENWMIGDDLLEPPVPERGRRGRNRDSRVEEEVGMGGGRRRRRSISKSPSPLDWREEEMVERSPSPVLRPIGASKARGRVSWEEEESPQFSPPSQEGRRLVSDSDPEEVEEDVVMIGDESYSSSPLPLSPPPPPPRLTRPRSKSSSEVKAPVSSKRKREDSIPSTSRAQTSGTVLRLKIRVQGRVLLVPVDSSQQGNPISWLCETAANRYKESYGEKPRLSLSTVDGALLSGMDPISLVLGDGMVLEARVLGYDNPPLTTRLQLASESLGIVPRPQVLLALTSSEGSGVLDVSGLNLAGSTASALFRSLPGGGGAALRELRLSECSLFDEDMEELGGVLGGLLWGGSSSLAILDLSCNAVTRVGLGSLLQGLKRGGGTNVGVVGGGLKELDLSLNPLGNGVAGILSQIVNLLPNLRVLRTSHSNLTRGGFYSRLGGGVGGVGKPEERLDTLDIDLVRRLGSIIH